MYRKTDTNEYVEKVKSNDSIKVVASSNHSMCLTKSGKIYTWGYKGKGLLGREHDREKVKENPKALKIFCSIGLPVNPKDGGGTNKFLSFKVEMKPI